MIVAMDVQVVIDAEYVESALGSLVEKSDLSRYVL